MRQGRASVVEETIGSLSFAATAASGGSYPEGRVVPGEAGWAGGKTTRRTPPDNLQRGGLIHPHSPPGAGRNA